MRKVDIREQVITVPEQQIITKDNVGMAVDGIIYVQITDVEGPVRNLQRLPRGVNLAQTNQVLKR